MHIDITTDDEATGAAVARSILKRFEADITLNGRPLDLHHARQLERRERRRAQRQRRADARPGDVRVRVPGGTLGGRGR